MISIVIPCYNCEKTLDKAVLSLLNQNYHDWEIILVDDGSNDSTSKLCDSYSKNDERIKVVHQENTGLMRAWKNGVRRATGEYVAFCDSDDFYDSDFLAHSSKIIEEYEMDMYACGMILDYEESESVVSNNGVRGYFSRDKIEKEILPNLFPVKYEGKWTILQTRVSKVYKKELLETIIPNLPDYISQGEDNLTVFSALIKADSIYVENDYTPYHYVRNNESMIGKYDENWYYKLSLLREELFKLANLYGFKNIEVLQVDYFFNTVTYIKKEITRSNKTFTDIVKCVREVGDRPEFREALSCLSLFSFSPMIFMFSKLIKYRQYILLCIITDFACKMGVGKP